ncbi:hypothetical protein [Candidatus Nitrosotenuis chungbukensis]|uniref:hypothetical protein n=1 Tax=Candidatus Nitrosotenuis chungbukensis TaxID=1353246 RepID=UPI0015A69309|nr:hypothetical protein [Candidatus Nitrosotenuis chungbukensis]
MIPAISALIFASILPIYAQTIPLDASMWMPSKVISKQEYHGLIVISSNPEDDVVFNVITDNEEVIKIITETVQVQKGKHHGLIKFETKGTGNAKIYAVYKDTLLEQNVQVVESGNTPTELDLIFPSTLVDVLVDNNRHVGYVFLLNDFGNPVIAEEPIAITLTSNGDITLQKNTVTINPGSHYARFSFEAKGEGSVTATAQNIEPDEASVSISDPSQIELHIEPAPNPIPTSSSAEVYFWLERDDKPYVPSHNIKITLKIDKSANLSFDAVIKGAIVLSESTVDRQTVDPDAKKVITRSNAQLDRDSTKEFVLEKGNYYGRATVYASFDGAGEISISGIAESANPPKNEETVKSVNTVTVATEKSTNERATSTKVFAFPDPALDKVEIIVSSESDSGPVLEGMEEDFVVFPDNKIEVIPATGKIKTNENYGIITAKVTGLGTTEIFAQRNEVKGSEETVEIKTKFVKNPDITVIPLPIIFGVKQDLFLISSSQDRIVTNPNSTKNGNLISITSTPSFDYEIIQDGKSVITVRGTINDLLEDDPVVHIASNAFTATETLSVYNPFRNKIESMHPSTVFAEEPFPIINYITDLDDNPLRKAELRISSGATMNVIGDLVFLNQSGTHGIIFYEKNTVPVESTITVSGSTPQQTQEQIQQAVEQKPTVFTYEIIVENGEGSGTYAEGSNVTISAAPIINDMVIIKKKLVGWENLPYAEATVTFEADFDVETRPIYQDDFMLLFLIGGAGAGAGAIILLKKRMKKHSRNEPSDEEKSIDELLDS